MRPFTVIRVIATVALVISTSYFYSGIKGNKVLGYGAIDIVY